MNKNKKIFAKNLSFFKIFIFFIVGSLFGSFFEEILYCFQHGNWTCRHDLIYGPFSTLYGFGNVFYLITLGWKNKERGIIKTFFLAALLGGLLEFGVSLIIELIFHLKFWDYSNMILNFQGRTTIPIMLVWGLMGTLLLKLIYPLFSKYIEKIPYKIGTILFTILFLFLIYDIILSYSVFVRMYNRNKGIPPKTKIGEIYDQKYDDEFMYNKFPILKGKFKDS